jgi:O-antigen/teichoic acid export membrane protein
MIISDFIRGRVTSFLHIVRLKSFDTSTIEGRSNERLRRVFWTASTSAVVYGVNTLTVFILVPITLGYLGAERYGLWMTITSLVAFLGFSDLGIGNVVINFISEANGNNDPEAARKYISNAFFLLISVSIGFILLVLILNFIMNWGQFFNVASSVARNESGPAVTIFLICFLINLPLNLIPRIQSGYQQGYMNNIWQGLSNLLALAGLFLIIHLRVGLPWLVLVISGFPIIGNILNGVYFFVFRRRGLVPRISDLRISLAKQMLWIGFFFLLMQIAIAIINYSDNIIIARILGPEAVTNYAVPAKLFALISAVIGLFLSPLWPAYGEAIAKGDDQWANSILIKSILLTFMICTLATFFLLIFGEKILYFWIGASVAFSLKLWFGLGIWTTLSAILTAITFFLNALKKISFQAIFTIITAFFALPTKIILVGTFGIPGVILGNILMCTLFLLIPYSIYLFSRPYIKFHR